MEIELIDPEDNITLLNLAIAKKGGHNATNFLELLQAAKGTHNSQELLSISNIIVHGSPTSTFAPNPDMYKNNGEVQMNQGS